MLHWHNHGLCRKNPDLFFPEAKEKKKASEAIAICLQCPVLRLCRAQALEQRERYGIWGGTTERERERIRRETTAA